VSACGEVTRDHHDISGGSIDGPIKADPCLMAAEFQMGIGEPDQALDVVRPPASTAFFSVFMSGGKFVSRY